MSTQSGTAKKGDILLEMRGLRIEGRVGEEWMPRPLSAQNNSSLIGS